MLLDHSQDRCCADPIHETERYSHQERIGKHASHPPKFSLSLDSSVVGTDAVPGVFLGITHPPQVPFLQHGDLLVWVRCLLRGVRVNAKSARPSWCHVCIRHGAWLSTWPKVERWAGASICSWYVVIVLP